MKKIFGILAYPAGHSLSPVMHTAGFKALGLPYAFEVWDIKPGDLGKFMKNLKPPIEGFSVSMPHKETIIPFLDHLDDAGRAVGAVSCVYMRDGKYIGTNLDYMGVKGSLLESEYAAKSGLEGKKVIVLGAGGAAKGAIYGLLQLKMIPIIFNRTMEKATLIAEQFSLPGQRIRAFTLEDLEANFASAEIIINCTSLGLGDDTQIVSDNVFSHIKLSLDAVYSHTPTIFQSQSHKAGAETLTGLEWLLNQGYEAFKLWTGHNAPKEEMRKSLLRNSF